MCVRTDVVVAACVGVKSVRAAVIIIAFFGCFAAARRLLVWTSISPSPLGY